MDSVLRVVQQQAFGQLQLQLLGRCARAVQNGTHLLHKIGHAQLTATDVDRHRQMPALRVVCPLCKLLAGCTQHPVPQRQNQAGVFCQRNKFPRRDQSPLRVLPAHQPLRAHQLPACIHLRLVVQTQLVFTQAGTQGVFQRNALHHAGVHLWVKETDAVAPIVLGLIHRQIGVLHQVLNADLQPQKQHHTDAASALQLMPRQHHRLRQRLQHLVGDHLGLGRSRQCLRVQIFQHDHKLITSQAGHGIALTHRCDQALTHFL